MANEIETIKQRVDIADLVREYVQLKQAGVNYKALCPFHHEKTPSFMVSPDRQSWHCFGCGEGGDIFSFIQKVEGVEFFDALKLLAKRVNVQLSGYDAQAAGTRSRIGDVLSLAMKFYHTALLRSREAEVGRNYLQKRGLDSITIDAFQVGYAPDAWEITLAFLKKRGFTQYDAVKAGLAVENQRGGAYDRFRGRIIFPISDEHGRIVGCTGRLLDPNAKEAKYVNSPQTEVFDKGRLLYALDRAKSAIRKTGNAIVMEGQMDVITAHQFGITNAVASSGTSLTDAQVVLLRRYAKRLIFAFDTDTAGMGAVKKAIDLTRRHDVDIRVALVPYGKDPDECIRHNLEDFRHAIETAVPAMEFFLLLATRNLDVTDVQQKKQAAGAVLPEIARLPNPVEKAHYVQRLAAALAIDENVLHEAIAKYADPRRRAASRTEEWEHPTVTTEEYILAAFLSHPGLLAKHIPSFDATVLSLSVQPLYIQFISLYSSGQRDQGSLEHALASSLPDMQEQLDRLRFLGDELRERFSENELALALSDWIANVSKASLKFKLSALQSRIRDLEAAPQSTEELQRLSEEYSSVLSRLKQFDS